MFNFTKAIRGVLKRKNAQIRAEREMLLAANETNKILATYIMLLSSGQEVTKVSKVDVSKALSNYSAEIFSDEDNYIIKIKEHPNNNLGNGESRAVE